MYIYFHVIHQLHYQSIHLLILLLHTGSKKGSSLYSIVNERIGFSTSHLENSSTVNQCEIVRINGWMVE